MPINHAQFFDGYRGNFGALRQSQVNGLDFLLSSFDSDPAWMLPNVDHSCRNIAYAMATIQRECANTWQPIGEYGSQLYLSKYYLKPSLRKALGNVRLSDSWTFKGRGYVQITGRANYTKFAELLVKPLVAQPELALEPETAFDIMTMGMFGGLFTGRRLGQFINPLKSDYYNARQVINGHDHASEIAVAASKFESILRVAVGLSK